MGTKLNLKTLYDCIEEFRGEYKLTTTQIQEDLIAIKDTVIKNLLEENQRLRKRVEDLEEKTDRCNEDFVEMERHSYDLEQYTRRNNLEISGVPNDVKDSDLEQKCIDILDIVNINVTSNDIEAVHRLPSRSRNSPKPVIIKFVNRKNVEKCCKRDSKDKLGSCDMRDLDFPEDTRLYFSENLSPYYRHLAWMCRVLKRARKISGTWFRDGKLFYKIDDNSYPVHVSHPEDLYEEFPDVDFV